MRIPKKFKVYGHTITVKMDNDLPLNHGAVGRAHSTQHIIQLIPTSKARPKSEVEQTYLHEVLHVCLDKIGYGEASSDEQFVDNLAAILHQVFTTSEY